MSYLHLATFQEGNKQFMRPLQTADILPTLDEWNNFVRSLGMHERDTWVLINLTTLKVLTI